MGGSVLDVWEESWRLGCSFYWELKGSGDLFLLDFKGQVLGVEGGIGPTKSSGRVPLPQGKGEDIGRSRCFQLGKHGRLPIETLSLYFRVAQVIGGEQYVPF